jgi:uncharacterized protein (DUF362 family)
MAQQFGAEMLVLDELGTDGRELIRPSDSHWQQGYALPRTVRRAGGIVQTCCLNAHRYGGRFMLSLKNPAGLAARRFPGDTYDFMRGLHTSPHRRQMIAEIDAAYEPRLIVLDGVEALVDGGPDRDARAASASAAQRPPAPR